MTDKKAYAKLATSYKEQLSILQKRGMNISDQTEALKALKHYNYYRLSAYWLSFKERQDSNDFKSGANFDDVLKLYDFDRRLRILVLDAIERIEVSVRGQWSYALGHVHGAHAHLNPRIAKNENYWESNKKALLKEVRRADELFIYHFLNNYEEELPPVWAACEVMSLGLLSKWYSNLKPKHTRAMISQTYGLDEDVLQSWLHHLAVVRNISAHHSRLWDRNFTRVKLMRPKSKPEALVDSFVENDQIYNSLIILVHFTCLISDCDNWKERIVSLLEENIEHLGAMGFPTDWKSQVIWL